MRRLVLAAVLVLTPLAGRAQTQQVLFPGQSGAQLLASIKTAFRPPTLGDYRTAQDLLMGTIDRTTVGGQSGVVGVYTGYFVPFDCNPSCDPNQDVFNGGSDINTEHTWPQSLLTGDPGPRSDLHHLFPTQVQANSDRGNFPFVESPDATTARWYRGSPPYTQTSIPTANIDEYSELRAGQGFEPREDHKGNVARALFYMRAVWDGQVTASFLSAAHQRTLYAWHYADPITAADQARSTRVANVQSGRENPFVLDSTLARRAYFPQIVVAGEAGATAAALSLEAAGAQPFRDAARLTLWLPAGADVRAEAFDALGRRVAVLYDGPAAAGPTRLTLDGRALAPGLYVVRATADGRAVSLRIVRAP